MKSENAKAASTIRKHLKANNIKARVTSKSYSMGSSLRVEIQQDVTPAAVKEIENYCNQFQYGSFDGMQDLYEYTNSRDDIPQVKYVFVTVDYSEEIRAASREYIDQINGIEEHRKDQYYWMALNGSWGDFWTTQKPRIRVAA